jgi:hypothetical protein
MVIFTGCATVDDFRKMSPTQRAEIACKNKNEFKSLADQKRQYGEAISVIQTNLARGYSVHTQCRNVVTSGAATTSCSGSYGFTTCTESRPKETKQVCQETPVSLNFDLERNKLSQYQASFRTLDEKINSLWNSCISYVSRLSSEDAYNFYRK